MYNYLYQITNLINNKIYIGIHKTRNIDDGYMGSGKIIKDAIKKYGIENFRKDILEFFDTYNDALHAETKIVTDEFLLREDVYNLRRGGTGGFDFINKNGLSSIGRLRGYANRTEESYKKMSNGGRLGAERLDKSGNRYRNNTISAKARELCNSIEANTKRKNTMTKIKHQQGISNSQYGTCWITNGKDNKKIKKDLSENYINDGWVFGRTR